MPKKQLFFYLIIFLLVILFVFVAYLIDSNKIATFADVESDTSAQQLEELPSPDSSILSKIYSAIIKPFTK